MSNKWTVSEYIKNVYMRTGRVPSKLYLKFEFPNIPAEELEDGIREFEKMVKVRIVS